jgi:hypothetical protein
MPAGKRSAPEDTVTARRVLIDGLARDADTFELASELASLHPRNNTFPGGGDAAEVAVLEPVAFAFEGDDLGVVDEAVDHGCGDDVVAEDFAPANRGWHKFAPATNPPTAGIVGVPTHSATLRDLEGDVQICLAPP